MGSSFEGVVLIRVTCAILVPSPSRPRTRQPGCLMRFRLPGGSP